MTEDITSVSGGALPRASNSRYLLVTNAGRASVIDLASRKSKALDVPGPIVSAAILEDRLIVSGADGSRTLLSVYSCETGAKMSSTTVWPDPRWVFVSPTSATEALLVDYGSAAMIPLTVDVAGRLTAGRLVSLSGSEVDRSKQKSMKGNFQATGPGKVPLVLAHRQRAAGSHLFVMSPSNVVDGFHVIETGDDGVQKKVFFLKPESQEAVSRTMVVPHLFAGRYDNSLSFLGQDGKIRTFEVNP